jgi:hypothetical protein
LSLDVARWRVADLTITAKPRFDQRRRVFEPGRVMDFYLVMMVLMLTVIEGARWLVL